MYEHCNVFPRAVTHVRGFTCLYLFTILILYDFEQADGGIPELQNENRTVSGQTRINPRTLFGALEWGLKSTGLYMAPCSDDEDCPVDLRMICNAGKCNCRAGDLFFEWPKHGCFSKVHLFGPCEVSGQCIAMNPNTYCNPDNSRCTCSPNYFYNGKECSLRYDENNLKAQEVYKAAVVAAACFIVAVVGIFVACIVRRSFCRREQQVPQNEPSREGDVFSISDEIAALRAVDKPPSYEEVLQIERTFYGIPPPEYTASRVASSSAAFSSSLCRFNLPYNAQFSGPSHQASTGEPKDSSCSVNIHSAAEEAQPEAFPSHDILIAPPPSLHRPPFTRCVSSSLPGSPHLNSHRPPAHSDSVSLSSFHFSSPSGVV